MEIREIKEGKRRFLDLLLLGDEQEEMVERYLGRGNLFVGFEEERAVAVCVVTDEGDGVFEVKNLAVAEEEQRQGIGTRMMRFVEERYGRQARVLQVGTGETPRTMRFYERCGYVYSHRVTGFFTEHYDHPIVEEGRQLVDMVYFRRQLLSSD